MNFEVDKIYIDTFYINMLLGLPKVLDKRRRHGVKGRHLTRYPPILPEEISAWEKKYGVSLPTELRKFYSSTNGFLFKWIFNFGHDRVNLVGRIEVNPLEKLQQIFGYETNASAGITLENNRYVLRLGLGSKVFEMSSVEERGKIVLVYINARYSPSIWFMDNKKNFYYITDCFAKYFRMMIAHLGITCWQLRFTPNGPPLWTETMTRILAPHLLPFQESSEGLSRSLKKKCKAEDIINKLDPRVFMGEYEVKKPPKKVPLNLPIPTIETMEEKKPKNEFKVINKDKCKTKKRNCRAHHPSRKKHSDK